MFELGIDKNISLYLPENKYRNFNTYYTHGDLKNGINWEV